MRAAWWFCEDLSWRCAEIGGSNKRVGSKCRPLWFLCSWPLSLTRQGTFWPPPSFTLQQRGLYLLQGRKTTDIQTQESPWRNPRKGLNIRYMIETKSKILPLALFAERNISCRCFPPFLCCAAARESSQLQQQPPSAAGRDPQPEICVRLGFGWISSF